MESKRAKDRELKVVEGCAVINASMMAPTMGSHLTTEGWALKTAPMIVPMMVTTSATLLTIYKVLN